MILLIYARALYIETHPHHPHLIRTRTSLRKPNPARSDFGGAIRYIAWFEDIDAGEMHAHEFLRRSLADIDNRLYRIDLASAIAAIESIRLRHKRIWQDPGMSAAEQRHIDALGRQIRLRQDRVEHIINRVGYAALALLAFNLLVLFLLE